MAGGPIQPTSIIPGAEHCYGGVYVGAGAIITGEIMTIVEDATTLDANTYVDLVFRASEVLPSGTFTLRITSRCPVTTGDLVVDPSWKSTAAEEDPDTGALNAEGDTTITWSAGDSDVQKETEITLDADTVVAGERVIMRVTFKNAGTTVAADSGHAFEIFWA